MSELRLFVPEADPLSPPPWRRGLALAAAAGVRLGCWWGEGLATAVLLSLSALSMGAFGGLLWMAANLILVAVVPAWTLDRAWDLWVYLWPLWGLAGLGYGAERLRHVN